MTSQTEIHNSPNMRGAGAVLVAFSALSVMMLTWPRGTPGRNGFRASFSTESSNSELIDALTAIEKMGIGYTPTYNDSLFFFLANDKPEDFDESFPDLVAPPQALRSLVSRGTAALPALLAHLDDKRLSRVQFTTQCDWAKRDSIEADGGTWCAAGLALGSNYDPRRPKPDRRVHNMQSEINIESHTVTVGDLCYVAVGQIVNRNLNVVGYTGSNTGVINSPTSRRELVESARDDWGGLSAGEHIESLAADAISGCRDRYPIDAIKRLCFYDRQAAEQVFHRLLSRPIYEEFDAIDLVFEQLLTTSDKDTWSKMFDAFKSKHGHAASLGALVVLSDHRDQLLEDEALRTAGVNVVVIDRRRVDPSADLERTTAILETLLPEADGISQLHAVVSIEEQTSLLERTVHCAPESIVGDIPQLIDEIQRREHVREWHRLRFVEACVRFLPQSEQRQCYERYAADLRRTLIAGKK